MIMIKKITQSILESQNPINPLDKMILEDYHPDNPLDKVAKSRAMKIATLPMTNTDYYPSEYIDFPYFTSVEIIANKAPFKDTPDAYYVGATGRLDYKEWVYDVELACKGIITESYLKNSKKWVTVVRNISHEYLSKNCRYGKRTLRENLLSLGWNPDIPFTEENRVKANKRFRETLKLYHHEIVDLSAPLLDEFEIMAELKKKNILYPLYIILVEGNSAFAHLTKVITNGQFSHAAISTDEKLDNMYSFNMDNKINPLGGFSIEDIKNYPQENKLGVFAIFVKEKDIHTIENMLDYYKKNTSKTMYSMLNVILLPLQKAFKMDMNMICSEFVDSLLKFCNININDKESPLVVPMDFYRASQNNKKIYKLYEDQVKKYKPSVVKRKIDRLLATAASYINESVILEIKDAPIQFSDEGDLLVKNPSKINYEKEYQSSHRLLASYDKADNIDGMKYELAKLWYLNYLLERDIYNGKNKVANSKCRSRVLNDYNKYIDIVLTADPDFNFSRYYASTPFDNATIRVKSSTLKYTTDIMQSILKSMV